MKGINTTDRLCSLAELLLADKMAYQFEIDRINKVLAFIETMGVKSQ